MGAIKDRSETTIEDAARFARLIYDDCDYIVLSRVLGGIKDLADGFCKNKFLVEDEYGIPVLDDDGAEQEDTIPDGVELWIMRKFARIMTYRESGSNEVTMAEVGAIKLDKKDWAELMPFVKYNGTRVAQNCESNLSYRVIDPYGDYYIC